jgi:putative membrane protein insertion efficiency factor
MKMAMILFIRAYQWCIAPLLGETCRFYPSCSHYAVEAISKHGGLKGGWMAAKRIIKCNPWHSGGVDEVP